MRISLYMEETYVHVTFSSEIQLTGHIEKMHFF